MLQWREKGARRESKRERSKYTSVFACSASPWIKRVVPPTAGSDSRQFHVAWSGDGWMDGWYPFPGREGRGTGGGERQDTDENWRVPLAGLGGGAHSKLQRAAVINLGKEGSPLLTVFMQWRAAGLGSPIKGRLAGLPWGLAGDWPWFHSSARVPPDSAPKRGADGLPRSLVERMPRHVQEGKGVNLSRLRFGFSRDVFVSQHDTFIRLG